MNKKYSGEFNVSTKTPPIFMVHAHDDGVKVENSFVFYQALKKQGISSEMHIVSKGGHGFFRGKAWGVPGKEEHRFSTSGSWWPVWTLNWMASEKLAPNAAWLDWAKRQAAVKAIVDPK
ncbi:MAG: acetyl esterase/lipase [Verrucomicrobiales bacterium]